VVAEIPFDAIRPESCAVNRGARVLVVGSGAREHALAAALASSAHSIVAAPGNAGTGLLGRNVPVAVDDIDGLTALAVSERADLVVVGPELPLTLGLVDALAARGVLAFGPRRAAARLEGSKAHMKRFCERRGIPTAPFTVFDDVTAAEEHVRALGRPWVVKADGLAGGKGVFVAETVEETLEALDYLMRRRELGDAGRVVILEERLVGEEASFHVICDGTRAVALSAAQDHKRLGDGDRGPNTGGMGAYAPAPIVNDEMRNEVMHKIVEPTLCGLAEEGTPFAGVLFVGLMIDQGRPYVLEYNVRFGDPEATVIVPTVQGDWYEILTSSARGDLSATSAVRSNGAALAVVMAAAGYPGTPRTGDRILGLEADLPPGAFVRHAGTRRSEDGTVVTCGGRVLAVGGCAPTLAAAAEIAYDAVGRIQWTGEHHRTDIGHRALSVVTF
jgi:phosphoribosylamine---glycine ligase